MDDAGVALIERLRGAVDAHDLDAVVSCFADNYRNDTPVHPSRGFAGREQVRANWQQIFAAVPDITADVFALAGEEGPDESVVWSEWEMRGTRRDGTPHIMRGVIIFGVGEKRAQWARFYLEPVDLSDDTVNDAVATLLATEPDARDLPDAEASA